MDRLPHSLEPVQGYIFTSRRLTIKEMANVFLNGPMQRVPSRLAHGAFLLKTSLIVLDKLFAIRSRKSQVKDKQNVDSKIESRAERIT